jgi:hypothetical protein
MGSGACLPAIATRPAKIREGLEGQAPCGVGPVRRDLDRPVGYGLLGPPPLRKVCMREVWMGKDNESDEAGRAISTGKLHALLRVHTRPIDVVVYHGSDREYWF